MMSAGRGRNLSLIDGDSVRFTAELPRDSCCESVAVGDDRVILRANETLSIYLLDGTLTHETVFTGETDGNWFGRQLGFVLLVAILAIAAALVMGNIGWPGLFIALWVLPGLVHGILKR